MFFKHNSLIIGLSLACIALPSCVDDKYDLSDVDTTVRVEVNELTLPIKLDEIKLGSILKEGDRIKIVDGNYMVVENGTFTSNTVRVDPVWIASKKFDPITITLPYVPGLVTGDVELDFSTPESEYGFNADNLPGQITSIDAVGSDLKIRFEFAVSENMSSVARNVEFRDLVLQLPIGLTVTDNLGGTYNPENGELRLPVAKFEDDNVALEIQASHIDFAAIEAANSENFNFNYDNHTVEVKGGIYVKSGKLALLDLIEGGSPTNIKVFINYDIPSFYLTTFSGGLKYDFEGVNFTDIYLDGMPDILSQAGTNIKVANPCIFLKVNNPMQAYGLTAQSGFTITASHGTDSKSYSLDEGELIEIGNDHADGEYTFCLSPENPTSIPEGYENPMHVGYKELSNVLSNAGNPEYGIPSELSVKLDNPQIPDQKIVDMPLNENINTVHGSYEFRAPIALEEGSTIIYEETVTGWGSDEFDYFTITQLDVDAELSCDIPIALDIEAYPVDVDGKQIGNVKIEGAHITAGSEPQAVHIHITGDIKGFDGIRYVAKATAGDGNEVLNTDMNIRVLNLRPTISGFYMKEL